MDMLNQSVSYPKKIWTDLGREFHGEFKSLCKTLNITHYHTYSGTKAAFAERAIRSLKAIIVRYLEEKWMWRYIDKLQDFVDIINTRVNRSIGLAPRDVTNADSLSIFGKRVSNHSNLKKSPKYKPGDVVRIAVRDTPFRKGYMQQFSNELFTIVGIATTSPPSYIIKDENNEEIKGKFYEVEIVKVTN